MKSRYDVIVVGARCAGAATALLLARAGASVLVVDRGAYGTDTLSTHALMRGAVLQLTRWGLLPAIVATGAPRVTTTTFHYTETSVPIAIESRFGVDALFAPRRSLLDKTLVDAATASGATFAYGVQLGDLTRSATGRVDGVCVRTADGERPQVRAGLVVGADGLYSTVASRVAARETRRGRHATAVLYAYWAGASSSEYQWFFAPGLSIGAIPTNNALCVFVAMPANRFRQLVGRNVRRAYHSLLANAAPDFYRALGSAREVEQVRGFAGHTSFMRSCHGPGWALVGDAGYFKDPLTAHGITDALRDAELLARAAVEDTGDAYAAYEQIRNELSEPLFDVTDAIASFAWDDSQLQQLHRSLSHAMTQEVKMLAALEPLTCLSSLGSARHAV